jgi:hypothetical protein
MARMDSEPAGRIEGKAMVTQSDVRWFVIFIKPDSDVNSEEDTPGFPDLDFWHDDKETAKREAKRVLRELYEQGDERTWKAVAHPDPVEVTRGNHAIDQWIVTSQDIQSTSDSQ